MSLSRCTSVWSWLRESATSWLSSFETSADSHSCDHNYKDAWEWPELGNISLPEDEDKLLFTVNIMAFDKCTECGNSRGERKKAVKSFRVEAEKFHEHEPNMGIWYAR